MTQDISPQTSVMERTPELVAASAPPENYADHLMDEIFGEVEQVLDGSLIPPDEPVKAADHPNINFDIAAALAERYPQLAEQLEDANAPDLPGDETELSKVAELSAPAPQPIPAPSNQLSLFERLMIFTGCASAVAALAVWLVSQGLITRAANFVSRKLAPPTPVASAPTTAGVNQADLQFSEYMLRSLAAIDRDAAANPQVVAVAPAPTDISSALPEANSGVSLPKPRPTEIKVTRTETAGNKAASTQGSPSATTPAKPAPIGSATPERTDLVTRTELNQVMNRIVGMLERVAPGVSSRLPIPAQSQAKAPAASRAAAVKPAQSAADKAKLRRISGVVDWGNKSVVTIEYNGNTQRVYLGDTVGSTGWSLVKVEDTKATFRKNGEFRTIADGESFAF